MNLDFTISTYNKLLEVLANEGYTFQTLEEFIESPVNSKAAVLRHDVDRTPGNALKMAQLENRMGIKASYYFRVVNESYDESIIKQIVQLNHEFGYHYEDLSLSDGNMEIAYEKFKTNLSKFRTFYPVKTICMHGSPTSKWDNRLVWEKFNYKETGIIAEPYFDLDFNKVFYITDASRSWNNEEVTVRDKVKTNFTIKISSTKDIIALAKSKKLPEKLMISTHPHNWAAGYGEWIKILLWQGLKNQVKRLIVWKA